jgi:hypothetical protein
LKVTRYNAQDTIENPIIFSPSLKGVTMSDSNYYQASCCPEYSAESQTPAQLEVSRRAFLASGGVLMGGLTFGALKSSLLAADGAEPIAMPTPRKPLIVKPILIHDIATRRERTSWRNWGCIQSIEEAEEEIVRIKGELEGVKQRADYPIEFLDVSRETNARRMEGHPDLEKCDAILLYGSGHNIFGIEDFGKDVIVFQRWDSGPVYRHIITVSARYLRQHSDSLSIPSVRNCDVVVDDPTELDWRFRALCGLKNTLGQKIISIGEPSGWANHLTPYGEAPEIAKKYWGFEYHVFPHSEIRRLIGEAKEDAEVMARTQKRAEAHLRIPGTKLETTMQFYADGFLLDEILRVLMKQVGTNILTVRGCMGGIMPASGTTACYTLTTLLDDGYSAFCESDFVAIPSGVLLINICGKPVFWANPCYPFKGTSTMAHCSAPRKMDGKTYDPVRIVTHYESDFGAAPWVDFQRGVETTHIIPSFKSDRWVGFKGVIENVPFKPSTCRSQLTVRRECSDKLLAENLVGFHWMTCYGDYRNEIGYALRRVGIQWDNLDEVPTREM